jgi:DNA (cytosine-5)-methyltransferase 1
LKDSQNGHSTIHSWDIIETTERQKQICYLLLKNRRKSAYGHLDGNPLSLEHFKALDKTITQEDLDELVNSSIFKAEEYLFGIKNTEQGNLSENEKVILSQSIKGELVVDLLKSSKQIKVAKISISNTLNSLIQKNIIYCKEIRYDFKNTKISTGLNGINRIFLPSSNIFPTLVASDTNDFITTKNIEAETEEEYKSKFIQEIYSKGNFRKITKEEACKIQGFPEDYILPVNRTRWMKLLGNSVSVPVIEILGKAILKTGVFELQNEPIISHQNLNSNYNFQK